MNRRMLTLVVLLAVVVAGCNGENPGPQGIDISRALGQTADADCYARAVAVRPFSFPFDHGAHPRYRNEWWYATGHLRDAGGNLYGFQVTLFRIAVAPQPPRSQSAWATNQVWMAHAAITDVAAGEHREFQRFARGALGLAGAQRDPVRVWLGDWSMTLVNENRWELSLSTEAFSLELMLEPLKPVVLQGDRGLSRKSPLPGNASYYYSQTRLATTGEITIRGKRLEVTGSSWLDREWGTSALAPDQAGWDWFSLQLDSGEELMFYRLRTSAGGMHPNSLGSWVTDKGSSTTVTPADIELEPIGWWRSGSGRRYPIEWRLVHPATGSHWRVRAVLADQEMNLTVIYWEGLVEVVDTGSGDVVGHGYLEMTGY